MVAAATALVLNTRTIDLVNSLRNEAAKSKAEFNVLRFFAEPDYASTCLRQLTDSGMPRLASLAREAAATLFSPPTLGGDDAAISPGIASAQRAGRPAAPTAVFVEELAPSAARRYTPAKELMNSLAVDAAGLRSVLFVLQLERTSTVNDLQGLLPRFEKLLAKSVGSIAASAMTEQVRQVLQS